MQSGAEVDSELVLVTGATGFIAGHIIVELLRNGYRVRGTMRKPSQTERVAHLTAVARETGVQLEFVAADLTIDGSFDDAVKGCDAVVHVASAVKLTAKDPLKDIIEPAVEGTKNLLRSVEHEPRVKTLVATSSYAAVENGIPEEERGPWTEEDYNRKASLDWKPYSFSKLKAEEAMVEWIETQRKGGRQIKYASIHPPYVIGPQLTQQVTSSNELFKIIMTGEYPLLPPLWFPTVDVRDVARAHVQALAHDAADGRYLTCNGHGWVMDYADMARKHFPEAPIPKRTLPKWAFKFFSLFDKRMDKGLIKENTQEGVHVDGSKIEGELEFDYKYTLEETIRDTCQSLVDFGCVPAKKGAPKVNKYETGDNINDNNEHRDNDKSADANKTTAGEDASDEAPAPAAAADEEFDGEEE